LKTRKKRKYGNERNLYINLLLVVGLGIHSLLRQLMPEGALTSLRPTVCDTYRYFVGQAVIDAKNRSRREYLIPTDNIIVLDHFFNLTKKSNLIGRLYYDLT